MNQKRLDEIRKHAKEIPEHSASFEDLIDVLAYVKELRETLRLVAEKPNLNCGNCLGNFAIAKAALGDWIPEEDD